MEEEIKQSLINSLDREELEDVESGSLLRPNSARNETDNGIKLTTEGKIDTLGDESNSLNRVKSVQSFINNMGKESNQLMESVHSYLMQSCFVVKRQTEANTWESKDGQFKYKLGIIDFLTEYNAAKKIENTFNNVVYWKERQDLSCQDPETYA